MLISQSASLWPVKIRRWPVLQLHAERESARSQHFLDLVERFAPQVRRLEKLGLGALDQVADVVDVLRLETIRRAYGELQIIDRTQEDRIDLRHRPLLGGCLGSLEVREHAELLDQNARRVADRLLRF